MLIIDNVWVKGTERISTGGGAPISLSAHLAVSDTNRQTDDALIFIPT